jgi:hypothetical protein
MITQPLDVITALKNAAVRLRQKAKEERAAAAKKRASSTYPGLGREPVWDDTGAAVNIPAQMLDEADFIDARAAAWDTHAAYADDALVLHSGRDQGPTPAARQAWSQVMAEAPGVIGNALYGYARIGHGVILSKDPAEARDDLAAVKAGLEYLRNDSQQVRYRASKNPRDFGKAFNSPQDAIRIAGEGVRQTPTIPAEGGR